MVTRRNEPKPKREPTHTVSFRVDARTHKLLENEATKLAMSPGAFARRLVVDALNDHRHAQILDEAAQTREDIGRLRGDLATALEVMLLNLTDASKEDVKAWIGKNLRR